MLPKVATVYINTALEERQREFGISAPQMPDVSVVG